MTATEQMTGKDILFSEPLDMESIRALAHNARQYHSVRQSLSGIHDELAGVKLSDMQARVASAHWLLGNDDAAKAEAAKASGSAVAQMILGILAEEEQDFEAALGHYTKAAGIAPSSAPCVLYRLGALRQLGRAQEALKLIGDLEREFGDKPNLFYHKGRCLDAEGQYDEALEQYEKALAIDARHAESLFHAARLLDQRGLDDEAKEYYQKIGPSANQTYINAVLNLALIHEDQGDYSEAAHCCSAVLAVQPSNRRARLFRESAEASTRMYYSPEETKQSERLEAILRVPVTDFELSVRSRNCLAKMDIRSLGDLVKRTESEMLAYKNFGETSLREIREMLSSRNLRLGMLREDSATRAAFGRSNQRQHEEILGKSIDELELSVRSRKCMDNMGIHTIGDLVAHSENELASAKNFGRVSLNEIKRKLQENSLSLKPGQ